MLQLSWRRPLAPGARAICWMLSVVLAAAGAVQTSAGAQASDAGHRDSIVTSEIRLIVESGRHDAQRWPLLRDVMQELRATYNARSWKPIWTAEGIPTSSARVLVRQLAQIDARGLPSADYDATRLSALVASLAPLTPAQRVEFDVMLTVATTRALRSLQFGRVPATAVHAHLRFTHELYDVQATLLGLTTSTNAAKILDEAEPPFLHYQLLKSALARLRATCIDTAMRTIRLSGMLRVGLRDTAIPTVRRTLMAFGDLSAAASASPNADTLVYDNVLVTAVQRFQRRHGIVADGALGTAAFDHKTPVFSSAMRYLVFSPFWDVPPSNARTEILPRVRRDPSYLTRVDFEIVSGSGALLGTSDAAVTDVAAGRARIRQRPGPQNALGGVKFVFPNAFSVYLHDTPAQSVLLRARRDASHGCIRLAEPLRLARFLLRDQPAWDSLRINDAAHRTTPVQVDLSRPVPVHIVYATAVARENGDVEFYADIYGHDRTLAKLLARGFRAYR